MSEYSSKDQRNPVNIHLDSIQEFQEAKIQIICILLDYNGNQAKDHNPSNVLFIKGSGLFIQESFKRPIHPRNEMPDYSSKDQRNPDKPHPSGFPQSIHESLKGSASSSKDCSILILQESYSSKDQKNHRKMNMTQRIKIILAILPRIQIIPAIPPRITQN